MERKYAVSATDRVRIVNISRGRVFNLGLNLLNLKTYKVAWAPSSPRRMDQALWCVCIWFGKHL